MSRPPKMEKSTGLNLWLPETIRARLDLELWDKATGRVPVGAYQKFFTAILLDYFPELKESERVPPRRAKQNR